MAGPAIAGRWVRRILRGRRTRHHCRRADVTQPALVTLRARRPRHRRVFMSVTELRAKLVKLLAT